MWICLIQAGIELHEKESALINDCDVHWKQVHLVKLRQDFFLTILATCVANVS